MHLSKQSLIIGILGIAIGIAIGIYGGFRHYSKAAQLALSQVKTVRQNDPSYKFINPLLVVDTPDSQQFGEYTDLNKKLSDLVDQKISQNKATNISIYFRGNQGRWVGINDTDEYYPASLLKVVVMIAYYQEAESNPQVLNQMLTYTSQIQNEAISSEYSTASSLKLNTSYRVDDLINDMIINSDNGAAYTLINSLDGKVLDEVYTDLGLTAPSNANYTISAKDYSLFFRILYNATYLDREYSEKALSLLHQTNFNDGLVAGLPAGTPVAHKYGEHVVTDSNGNQNGVELHDCGLVYGNNPFLLCVMTRGQNLDDLKATIRDITSLVYDQVKNGSN